MSDQTTSSLSEIPFRQRFVGKVAFITGAARGQGRAHAVRLASEGAQIIALDSCSEFASTAYDGASTADLDETVRLVEGVGGRIVARVADVRDFDGLSAVLNEGIETFGRLDLVVANAGICSGANSWEISAEKWQETIDVNLTGVFHTAKAAIPHLISQGEGGSMVFTSSVSGLKGTPFNGHYVASKWGVTGLAQTMALELASHNIRVNSVHPAGVDTGMKVVDMFHYLEQHAQTLAPVYMTSLPAQIAQPEDIADAVAYLLSDEARYITGTALPVDLGNVMR